MNKLTCKPTFLKYIRNFFLLLTAISLEFTANAKSAFAQDNVECPTGLLAVDTSPVKGEVFVDGKSWGTAPREKYLACGKHTVGFGTIANYTKPANQTVTVQTKVKATVTGTYVLNTGILLADTSPVSGEIFVNGVSWGTAPESKILTSGSYTVSFGEMKGYITPPDQTVTVQNDQTAKAIGIYTSLPPETGILSVDSLPVKGEIFVDGVSWGTAPESKVLPVGSHTVSFGDVTDYDKPDSQTATVEKGLTTRVVGIYTRQTGTLGIMTTPVAGEVFVNGESWGISPQAKEIPTGTWSVSFGEVNLYTKPGAVDVIIQSKLVTTTTGTYIPLPPSQGNLSVDTGPIKGPTFVNGESWGTAPKSKAVNVGNYTVSFGDLDGYTTPQAQIVSVQEGVATNVTGTYEPLLPDTGVLLVMTTPVLGNILVDGASWGTAPAGQLTTVGDHVVSFGDVPGYLKPSDQTATVDKTQTTRVDAEYIRLAPSTGILSADTTPVKGELFVDNVRWGTAPESRTIAVGTHTVRFGEITGFITPDIQTLTVNENQTTQVMGTYNPILCTLTETIQGKGTIEPAGGPYQMGEKVAVMAIPNTGRVFSHWEQDLTGTDNPTTLTMDSDKNIKAVFTEQHGPWCGWLALILIPALLTAGYHLMETKPGYRVSGR